MGLLAFSLIEGYLSSRTFAILGLLVMIAGSILFGRLFAEAPRDRVFGIINSDEPLDATARRRLSKKVRTYSFYVIVLVCLLILGIWDGRDGPLLPLLLGATVNLALVAGLIAAILEARKRLKD